MAKSLEQRLYEAYRSSSGLRLSADDVADLMNDDALCTRITNVAGYEAGREDAWGFDAIPTNNAPTWKRFRQQFAPEGGL